jgi:hypothetical protein
MYLEKSGNPAALEENLKNRQSKEKKANKAEKRKSRKQFEVNKQTNKQMHFLLFDREKLPTYICMYEHMYVCMNIIIITAASTCVA